MARHLMQNAEMRNYLSKDQYGGRNGHEVLDTDIGQRATDGPSGWLFISDVVLKYYAKSTGGCLMADPIQIIQIPCYADMFVDNNTVMHDTDKFVELAETLMIQTKQDAEV
eukprot:12698736-Ditylum_brightwellii.AAC.1